MYAETILDIIEPFIEGSATSDSNLGYRYGSSSSMGQSLKNTNSSMSTRTIISIKSIDLGDNNA